MNDKNNIEIINETALLLIEKIVSDYSLSVFFIKMLVFSSDWIPTALFSLNSSIFKLSPSRPASCRWVALRF